MFDFFFLFFSFLLFLFDEFANLEERVAATLRDTRFVRRQNGSEREKQGNTTRADKQPADRSMYHICRVLRCVTRKNCFN